MKLNSDNVRLHATVEGRVQGVGFRYFAQREAVQLNITGWVRNRWNGSVEIIAEGEKAQIEKLLNLISRGPRSGTTQNVKIKWGESTNSFTSFRIRMTA